MERQFHLIHDTSRQQ